MILMLVIAFLFDVSQWVLFPVSSVIGIIGWLFFFVWLNHYGANMFNTKNIERTLATILGEFLPVINAAPILTISIYMSVRAHNKSLVGGV